MELKEALGQEKEKIVEALKSIGYVMAEQVVVDNYFNDLSITLTIRKEGKNE